MIMTEKQQQQTKNKQTKTTCIQSRNLDANGFITDNYDTNTYLGIVVVVSLWLVSHIFSSFMQGSIIDIIDEVTQK